MLAQFDLTLKIVTQKEKRKKKRNRFAAAITNVLIKSRKKIYFEFGSYLICFVAGVTLWYGGGGGNNYPQGESEAERE